MGGTECSLVVLMLKNKHLEVSDLLVPSENAPTYECAAWARFLLA